MFTSLALSLIIAGAGEQPASRLAVICKAPDFTLINQDGKTVKLSNYKGQVLLVSFIFTTCNGSCPATTHRMSKIFESAKARDQSIASVGSIPSGLSGGVQFVSVSLDPQRDTPEALKQYMNLYDLASDRWNFCTGTPDAVNKTIAAWGMWVKPTANGQLDHPSRIFLVDQQLRIREIYNVDLLRPADVLDDIRLLLAEAAAKK